MTTEHKSGGVSPQQSKNPYEDADPIPVVGSSNHRQQPRTGARTRSRSVQSARDAARRQERITRIGDDASYARHTNSGTSTSNAGARNSGRAYGRDSYSTSAQNNGYTPATSPDRRRPPRQAPKPYTMRTRRKMGFGILASIIIAAIVILLGILWFINRPVPITVNGEEAEVRVSSTLEEVLHEEEVSVEPGNYVSVTERVLQAGKGHAFTASVNGQTLSPEEAEDYHIKGNEAIEFTDGEDIVEDFEADSEVIMPYLRMEGNGYSLQYISQWGYAGELQHRKGKESGEYADVITKEAQDCVITCMDPYIEGDTKYVALTFDDGPADPYTEEYLKILSRYGVKATFFNLGENAEAYPDIAKEVVAQGHQLCNHTMAHNQLTAVDAETIYSEITRSEKALEEASGVKTTHLRPPYGDFTERSWLGSGGSITASIRWNADSQDWKLPGVDTLVSNSLINLHSGTIILMHDGGGDRSQDVEALPILIEELQSQGYTFVTIADLMRATGTIPEDICSGSGTMPKDATWPEEIHPDDIAAAAAATSSSS